MPKYITLLRKKAKAGNQGHPMATLAFYGPDNKRATKAVLGIILRPNGEPNIHRYFNEEKDVRYDTEIQKDVLARIAEHGVKSVIMVETVWGCPHEEGVDYPEGEKCPHCPYWATHDRGDVPGDIEDHPDRSHGATKAGDGGSAVVTGIAWYREGQWERFREVAADRDKLESTWREWAENVERTIAEMRRAGLEVCKVDIDVDELVAWCGEKGKVCDSAARATYVSEKLRGGTAIEPPS